MICFNNDDNIDKEFKNIAQFNQLHFHLRHNVLRYMATIIEGMGKHLTITSVWRQWSSDHANYKAVDVRARDLTVAQREEVERRVNERFGVGVDGIPTCKYWHPGNSPKNKYPPHFHVRVE